MGQGKLRSVADMTGNRAAELTEKGAEIGRKWSVENCVFHTPIESAE